MAPTGNARVLCNSVGGKWQCAKPNHAYCMLFGHVQLKKKKKTLILKVKSQIVLKGHLFVDHKSLLDRFCFLKDGKMSFCNPSWNISSNLGSA